MNREKRESTREKGVLSKEQTYPLGTREGERNQKSSFVYQPVSAY